jgi:hypothetical protein
MELTNKAAIVGRWAMEELVALGGLMVSGGTSAAMPVDVTANDQDVPAAPVYTQAEQSATDAVFRSASTTEEEPPPLPVAALVVSAAVANLKGIVLDEAHRSEKEKEEEERQEADESEEEER